jgi:hypothetical protein
MSHGGSSAGFLVAMLAERNFLGALTNFFVFVFVIFEVSATS